MTYPCWACGRRNVEWLNWNWLGIIGVGIDGMKENWSVVNL